MTDFPVPDLDLPETDEDALRDDADRFDRPYDDVFNPDGSLIRPMSVLNDPSDLDE